MKQEPHIYLYARNKQRFRYNLALQTFETCKPAKRSLINSICCKQWGQWQAIDEKPPYTLIESLKLELLAKQGYFNRL